MATFAHLFRRGWPLICCIWEAMGTHLPIFQSRRRQAPLPIEVTEDNYLFIYPGRDGHQYPFWKSLHIYLSTHLS